MAPTSLCENTNPKKELPYLESQEATCRRSIEHVVNVATLSVEPVGSRDESAKLEWLPLG
jgi:hypothetical protein